MKYVMASVLLTLACSTSFAYESRYAENQAQELARQMKPTSPGASEEIFILGTTEVRNGSGGAELHFIVSGGMEFQIAVGSIHDLCSGTGSYELKETGSVYEIVAATCL